MVYVAFLRTIIYILLIFVTLFSYGQDLIAVQNGGTPSFYEDLQLAITIAQAGDTLYLPGGSFGKCYY